jgi:hypothetical protein
MATLELQVEIDSEVHPELYALLAAVGRASLRPERLRQLAAGGLIWEHLRAQPRLDAAAQPALAETARAADRAALARAAARAVAAPAEPVPAPAVEEPPVLQDVVELAPRPAPRSRSRAAAPAAAAQAAAQAAAPAVAPPRADEAPAAAAPPAPDGATKTGPRSRLLLMKERGLFKNG